MIAHTLSDSWVRWLTVIWRKDVFISFSNVECDKSLNAKQNKIHNNKGVEERV